jgi:hypothetical protein
MSSLLSADEAGRMRTQRWCQVTPWLWVPRCVLSIAAQVEAAESVVPLGRCRRLEVLEAEVVLA